MSLSRIEARLKKKNPRVLLVNPAFRYTGANNFPLGLGYIAGHLKKRGITPIIIDEQSGVGQIGRRQIEQIQPDIVGITATSPVFHRVSQLINSIKKVPENIQPVTVLGGIYGTFRPEKALQTGIDIVVRGEADNTIYQLFDLPMEEINGISYRKGSEIIQNRAADPVYDLDLIPFPARELFTSQNYPVMGLTTSRGCPFTCSYCSATKFWQSIGKKVRYHSLNYVEKELEQIADLGYDLICFEDATFTLKDKRTISLCQILKENEKINRLIWSCQTGPNELNPNILDDFEESRCIMINLGVESTSEEVLKENNRHTSIEKLVEVVNAVKNTEITLQLLLIFGLPGETSASVNETINFLHEYQPDRIVLSLATAYPGTELELNTHRINPPLEWRKRFVGHGGDKHSELVLPKTLTEKEYLELAEKMLREVQKINTGRYREFRRKQDRLIRQVKALS